MRGRVNAPGVRVSVYGPSAKRRGVWAAGAVEDPAVAGVDPEQPVGGLRGAVGVQFAQQAVAGAPDGGRGQPGLHQRPGLDGEARHGGAGGPEHAVRGGDGHAGADEPEQSGPGQREHLPQPGPGGPDAR